MTDVDGTVSRIAPNPEDAVVSDRCRGYLKQLVKRLPLVAALSGRPAAEARRVVGVEGLVYIGNHGLERWASGETMYWAGAQVYTQIIPQILSSVMEKIGLDGIGYEDKGVSASLHYRNAPDRELARTRILESLSGIEEMGLVVKEGRMVVELRPDIPVHKGTAVMSLAEEYSLRAGIYIGDDRTDVDAFDGLRRWAMETRSLGVTVAVLSTEVPAELVRKADYSLDNVEQVEDFLGWLSQIKAKPGP